MKQLLHAPLHCFLLAAYFPLWYLSANLGFFAPLSANRAILLNLTLAGAALLLFRPVFRNWSRAGLASSLLVGLLFSFPLSEAAVRLPGLPLSPTAAHLAALFILALSLVGGATLIARMRIPGRQFASVVLNVVTAVMLIQPVAKIAGEWALSGTTSPDPNGSDGAQAAEPPQGSMHPAGPSIFHIVLDGYSREDVLQAFYGFDNSGFTDELRQLGFFVADAAASPYSQTLLTMNAVFAADFINDVLEAGGPGSDRLRHHLSDRVKMSPVRLRLDALGYRSIAVETDYHPLQLEASEVIETAVASVPTSFERALYRRTPLMGWYDRIFLENGGDANATAIRGALRPVELDTSRGPIFLYNHVIAPHPPFGVDRFGNPRTMAISDFSDGSHFIEKTPDGRDAYRIGYLEKLRYVNSRLTLYLRHMIEEIPGEKIVIVHGDHGGGLWLDQESADRTCLRERFGPLLAVYSSDGRLQQAMTDNFNLVNLYRLVFATYFGDELPLLEGRSYFASWSEPATLREIAPGELGRNCPTRPPAALP